MAHDISHIQMQSRIEVETDLKCNIVLRFNPNRSFSIFDRIIIKIYNGLINECIWPQNKTQTNMLCAPWKARCKFISSVYPGLLLNVVFSLINSKINIHSFSVRVKSLYKSLIFNWMNNNLWIKLKLFISSRNRIFITTQHRGIRRLCISSGM